MKTIITLVPPPIILRIIADTAICCMCIISILMYTRWKRERKELMEKIEGHESTLRAILSGQEASPVNTEISNKSKDIEDTFIERLNNVMDKYLSDENFNVTIMTKELGMSRTALFTKMKSIYGVSPQTWITNFRLNRATELLTTREHNVSEVSEMVGFATITGFSRSFKNIYGVSPSTITRRPDNQTEKPQPISQVL